METGRDILHGAVRKAVDQTVDLGGGRTCHYMNMISSRGIWVGDDPFVFSFPLLLLQLSLISIITRSIYLILKPFGQPLIVSQILGGVILGPSILGHNMTFAAKVFPIKGRIVLDTLSVFGFMLFIFLIGVKMDPSMVLKSGRKAFAIGILGFSIPYALAELVAFVLSRFVPLDHDISRVLPLVAQVVSMTSFPVIACFLSELKILNSEIGRLATSSSIICDVCQWFIMSVKFAARVARARTLQSTVGFFLSATLLLLFIVFGIRPAALWAIRRTPEGKPVKEIYIFVLIVALLGCGFIGEYIGLSALVASFFLGLVIPDGPPLGAALVERLDCFVSVLLMPLFFTTCGLKMDVFTIQNLKNVGVILLVVYVAFLGKIIGTILLPLFWRMPFRDALSLALIMNSKGIVELALLNDLETVNVMNEECFAIMILSVVVMTGVISPLVKTLYDPSRRFLAYKKRTVLDSKHNEELRVLACIHSQDNVQEVVNLLDASRPTKESPLNLVVLHLVKLEGRASSLLIPHRPREKPSINSTQSERIFNAFRKFEQEYRNLVTLHCFKGISPYATMHNDVCLLALEKRTTLIIIPFHKQWTKGERVESSYAFRHLNKNVLDKAPCSVGILINHKNQRKHRHAVTEPSFYRVVVLFFGGADDREALAYARRMLIHQNVKLTLLRFCACKEIVGGTARSRALDSELLEEFRRNHMRDERVSYQEKVVKSKIDVLSVCRSVLGTDYNLVMVGRRHGEFQFMCELARWNEPGELGTVGEILAASVTKSGVSVLVVQQQTRVWGMHDPEEPTHLIKL